jgi:hypothetical protein
MVLLEDPQTRGYGRAAVWSGVEGRIFYLDDSDRKLLELVLQGKLTRREAGVLVGLSCGTVTRRLQRIINRLHDPLVKALVDCGKLLPEWHQEVGLAYFLRRWSVARITREYGMTEYEVKRIIQYVRGWRDAMKRK